MGKLHLKKGPSFIKETGKTKEGQRRDGIRHLVVEFEAVTDSGSIVFFISTIKNQNQP
jgi:hypothetical protein